MYLHYVLLEVLENSEYLPPIDERIELALREGSFSTKTKFNKLVEFFMFIEFEENDNLKERK